MAGKDILDELSLRAKLVNAVPAATFLVTTGGLVLSGVPAEQPTFGTLMHNAHQLGWIGAAAAVLPW
jgi:hypothetical protein